MFFGYTDKEIKALKEKGAIIELGEHEYKLRAPKGIYCPQCKKKIPLNEDNDLSFYSCPDCRTNWINPDICTDDDQEYIHHIVTLAIKGRVYF